MKSKENQCRIDTIRMKDIVAQLTDIIYLLCDAKGEDTGIILHQLTNLTTEEYQSLHLVFPSKVNSSF